MMNSKLTEKEVLNFMLSNENVYGTINRYAYNPRNVYDSFINAFRELKEKIYLNVENILIQKNNASLDMLIEDLKDTFNDAENILSNLVDFFEDEYYDFSSIKDMAFYILDNKSLLHNISIIKGLLNSFYNLIQFKKNSSNSEYELKYDDFSSKLMDVEQFFYTKIYEPSEKYNEEILSEISRIISSFKDKNLV